MDRRQIQIASYISHTNSNIFICECKAHSSNSRTPEREYQMDSSTSNLDSDILFNLVVYKQWQSHVWDHRGSRHPLARIKFLKCTCDSLAIFFLTFEIFLGLCESQSRLLVGLALCSSNALCSHCIAYAYIYCCFFAS